MGEVGTYFGLDLFDLHTKVALAFNHDLSQRVHRRGVAMVLAHTLSTVVDMMTVFPDSLYVCVSKIRSYQPPLAALSIGP